MQWSYAVSLLSTHHDFSIEQFKALLQLDGRLCWSHLYKYVPDPLGSYLKLNLNWVDKVYEDFKECLSHQWKITFPGQPDFPHGLLLLQKPPLCLFYLGEPIWQTTPQNNFLSVVGSREPCPESLQWMEIELSQLLEKSPVILTSGGARGIDQKAHAMSVRSGVPTIAFLPSGLGTPYPNHFSKWYAPILKSGGGIVSEYRPHQQMKKHHFQRRNRLIAGLSKLVLVVEARQKGGTMLTAKLALENGREIGVLPAFPLTSAFEGNLELLFDGAHLIRTHRDLLLLLASL